MGVTLVAASGDDGANPRDARETTGFIGASACGYMPVFPTSCPYVTSVGATSGPEMGTTEVTCSSADGSVITGGGGFSTHYSRPSFQDSVVPSYLTSKAGTDEDPVAGYNAAGRGYPDISAAGLNPNTNSNP
jgi:tripeptidyl-peptidase-1